MLPTASLPPTNLPAFLTTFVGRDAEIAQVKQQLSMARLLTLTGTGGCGKTRLALQVAAQRLPEYRDGVWWCDLAAVTDSSHIAPTIASVLQLAQPANRAPLDSLTDALRNQRALLVLDNCEHLLAGCAAFSLALLRACPGVTVLATSLQPLGLPQEQVWPVPPMSVLDPVPDASAQPIEPDAVRLFVERAARARPSFQLTPENRPAVVAICRRLDGLPLALELAAARSRLLTVEQIAERLDDAFSLLSRGSLSNLPRHQTLRLALDWSDQFLSAQERVLLRRLAVFAGPFSLSMVEAVCGTGIDHAMVLDLLDGLADKSFVAILPRDAAGEPHCRLLELIRQYARERLEDSGEAAEVRDRYLDWCATWAEQAATHLTGAGRGAWIEQCNQRQEHVRAALRWACTGLRAEPGLRLAGALARFWMTNGLSEGRAWLEELLAVEAAAQASGAPPTPDNIRAWGLLYAGRLAVRQGDAVHGQRRGEESLALFRAAADAAGKLAALNVLALAAQDTNDYERAETCYGEALALCRPLGDERMTSVLLVNQGLMFYEQQDFRRATPIWDQAYAIMARLDDYSIASWDNLGCLAMMRGDPDRAQDLFERELERQREAGDPFAVAILMMDLGELARRQGDLDRAQALLLPALERQRQLGDRYRLGETLCYLGNLARNRGAWTDAQGYYEQSLASLESAAYTRLVGHVKTGLGRLEAAQGRDHEALTWFREALRVAQAGQHRLCRVEALEGIAGIFARRGETQRAARWLIVTQAAREDLGAPSEPVECERLDQLAQQLRVVLGDLAYDSLRADDGDLDNMAAEALGGAESPTPAAAKNQLIPKLRVLAFGQTNVRLGERSLLPTDWTYAKSKELLFYLLAHSPATKAQIGLDLWPDASPNQLRAAFHSALHRLRRALGRPDWIVHAGGAYSLNSDLPLEHDAASFEDHLRQSRLGRPAAARPAGSLAAIAHLEAARALWRGDYLADVKAGDWAMYRREALRQAFLDGLLRLAELRFAEAQYLPAAEAFRQALSLDSYLELAHRGLMRCYARQGEAAQAVRHYQTLRQILESELSTAPSPETALLFDRIRRGDDI